MAQLKRIPTTVLSEFNRRFNRHPEVNALGVMAFGRNGFSTARSDINLYAAGERGGQVPLNASQIKRVMEIATGLAAEVSAEHTRRRSPTIFTTRFHTTQLTKAMNAISKRWRLTRKLLGEPIEPEFFRIVFIRRGQQVKSSVFYPPLSQ